jgi:hypothetical protein
LQDRLPDFWLSEEIRWEVVDLHLPSIGGVGPSPSMNARLSGARASS